MRRVVLCCGIVALLLSTAALPASADAVACGMVVTEDVVLDEDLTCPGTAFLLLPGRSEAVTIDLNGHTVSGPFVTEPYPYGPSGVWVQGSSGQPSAPVTVRDGTIRGFVTAVGVAGNPDVTVEDVHIVGNRVAAFATLMAVRLTLRGNRIDDNGAVIAASNDSDDMLVEDNAITDSGTLSFTELNDVTIRSNAIRGSSVFPFLAGNGLLIEDNLFAGSDTAVRLLTYENVDAVIRDNTFRDNRVGVQLGRPIGLPDRFDRTRIEDNTFVGNATAGLVVDLDAAAGDHATGTTIVDNTFIRNGWAPDGSTDGEGQTLDDGLHVLADPASPGITVSDNLALRNGDLGIEASGVVDGGGNRALVNGDPRQCTGVVCHRS